MVTNNILNFYTLIMNFKTLCVFFFSFPLLVFSQNVEKTVRSLEECVALALNNNLDLKQAHLSEQSSAIYFKDNKNALLPSLNANYNYGNSSGRSIDPYTNAFVTDQLRYSNAGLGLDATIFNGFRLINSWKQSKLNLKAAEMETQAAKQTLILNVTLAYLQVLNYQDLVRLAEKRLSTTQGQLDRLQTMFEEEVGNPAEYRDLQGQVAADAANLLDIKNNLEIELLNLNTLVNAPEEINVASIDQSLAVKEYAYSSDEVYAQALQVFPSVLAKDLYSEAANKEVAIARSQFAPRVSLFANLNTNYSSAARLFNETGTSTVATGDFVTINNQQHSVFTEKTNFSTEKISYFDQMDNNLSTSFGVAVSIPIFNGFKAKNSVALKKIKRTEAQVILDKTKLELKQSVIQSHRIMQTAFGRYKLLENQVAAYQESFRINEILFNTGVSTSVDYLISKNTLEQAQINLANVGYEYLLRVKVLEYYRGNI